MAESEKTERRWDDKSGAEAELTAVDTRLGSRADHVGNPSDQLEYVPDGGKEAWTVVLGSSLALFASAGMINAYGAFQDYYKKTLLPSSSASYISLIGSLQVFFLYLLGTFTGRIFDAYGTKYMIPAGSFVCVFALMMVSLCQNDHAYQVLLSQGVLFGIGIALLFSPSIAVLGHWFRRRRALAIGLTTGSSAVGGVVFPIILEQLIPRVGFGWAVRIIAFILLVCLSVACLTIRTRLPLSRNLSLRTAIDLSGFKDPRYTLATVGSFLLFYGFFIPYFYIQTYANFRGVSPHIANYLLSILNTMNVPSRIIPGYIADKVGPLKVFIPAATICSILILGLWLPSRDEGAIVAFSALYGLFSGAYVSLLPTYIATISPRETYGARLGSVYMIVAVATLVGTPTGGALLKVPDQHHFNTLIVFCGVMTLAGFKKGTNASSYTQLYTAFALSGVVHVWGDFVLGKPMGFFLANACAITFEDAVIAASRRLLGHRQEPTKWTKRIGYLWVIAWFYLVGPLFVDWYTQFPGIAHEEFLPFSLIRSRYAPSFL